MTFFNKYYKLEKAQSASNDLEETFRVEKPGDDGEETFFVNINPNQYEERVRECSYIHEVLNLSSYVYCDFDLHFKSTLHPQGIEPYEEMDAVIELYNKFQEQWEYVVRFSECEPFDESKCFWLKSKGNMKCSYHFIYKEVMVRTEQQKLWNEVQDLISEKKFKGIDLGVYCKNKNMRGILSNKVKDNSCCYNTLTPWDFSNDDFIDSYNCKDYLINTKLPDTVKYKEYVKPYSLSEFSTDLTQKVINDALEFVKKSSPNAEIRDVRGNLINLVCYGNCPVHDRVHRNNNPYVTVFEDKFVINCKSEGERRPSKELFSKFSTLKDDATRLYDVKGMNAFDDSDDEDEGLIIEAKENNESKSDIDVQEEEEEEVDNNIFDNTGSKYKVFDDYDKLKKNTTLDEVKKFVQSTICLITEGGKSSYITRNETYGSKRYTFTKVEKADLIKTLDKTCFIKNPNYNSENPISKKNKKHLFTSLNEIVKYFDQNNEIKKYYGRIFEPYLYPNKKMDKYLNEFEGFSLQREDPMLGKDFEKTKIFTHIKEQICDNDIITYEYMLNWIAHFIQFPNENPKSSILLYSLPGGGKDWFNLFISLLTDTQHHMVIDNPKTLLQQFNVFLVPLMLITLNEVSSGGLDKKLHEQFKSRVTQDFIHIEIKHGKSFNMTNRQRMIMNTNNRDAMYIEPGERRTLMVEMSNEKCHNKPYFDPIWEETKDKNILIGAFNYFANRDISNFDPKQVPKTKYHQNQAVSCFNNVITFTKELVNNEFEVINTQYYSKIEGGMAISITDMYEQYKRWCEANGERSYKKKTFKIQVLKLNISDKMLRHTTGKSYRGYKLLLKNIETEMGILLSNPNYKISTITSEAIEKPKMIRFNEESKTE